MNDGDEVIGVFRRCQACGKWKRLGNFRSGGHSAHSHKCYSCRLPVVVGNPTGPARSISITPAGYATLREMKRDGAA